MNKSLLALFCGVLFFAACFHISTAVGIRLPGRHEVTIDVPARPTHDHVGLDLFSPDGCKVMMTSISRHPPAYRIRASVHGTHRYALALFPLRLTHSFGMDRPLVEWTVCEAAGIPTAGYPRNPGRRWHDIR